MYDHLARQSFKQSPASVVYWIVLSSYAYYFLSESLLSDTTYDKMCKLVLEKGITHSKLSHLINEDRLRAGSLFDVKEFEYPLYIVRDAQVLINERRWYGVAV